MKKMWQKMKSSISLGKVLWFTCVFILVIYETIHFQRVLKTVILNHLIQTIDIASLILVIILGIVATVPTLFYDFLLSKKLQTNLTQREVFENSWIVNSINHFLGLPGVTDRAIRLAFFSQKDKIDETISLIQSFLPYMMTGFSLFAILSALISFQLPLVYGLKFVPWVLLLSSVLLPLLPYIFKPTHKQEDSMTLSIFYKLGLFITSFIEYGSAFLVFYTVGSLFGTRPPISVVMTIYFFSFVIGRLSFVPGGLGSFDLVAMASLSLYGSSPEIALLWLLIFRMVYHVIPGLLGLVVLIRRKGKSSRQEEYGIPKSLFLDLLLELSVFLTRLFGIFLVLSALVPQELSSVTWIKYLNPIHSQLLWEFPSIILGLCFILIARALNDRVRLIFRIALIWIVITFFYINLISISWFTSFLLILVFWAIYSIKSLLIRKQFIYSWESRTKDALMIFLLLLVLFSLAGVFLPYHVFRGHHVLALKYYLYHLGMILIVTNLVAIFYFFLVKILNGKRQLLGEVFNADRYRTILETFGGNEEAGLAFIGDKRLYWYQDNGEDKVVFQFGVFNNKCIIMGEPVGDLAYQEAALTQFMSDADSLNYELVFYEVGQELTLYLHDYGYDFMKAGEEAKINLANFTVSGKKYKNFRNILNQTEKNGYSFKIMEAPHSQKMIDQLEHISTIWLKGRKEKGFSLGYFDESYLQEGPIATVISESGDIVAFANLMNNGQTDCACIDLMRYDETKAPIAVMDYLFLKLILHYQNKHYDYFSMGVAPLSNVGQERQSFIHERIAYLVYHLGTYFYSFDGLRRYKQKFKPDWQPVYISYSRHGWLIYDMIALQMVHKGENFDER